MFMTNSPYILYSILKCLYYLHIRNYTESLRIKRFLKPFNGESHEGYRTLRETLRVYIGDGTLFLQSFYKERR